jgi:hypothetical protein
MSTRAQIIGIVAAIALLVLVVEFVRRRRLRIGYSLLWLLTGLTMLGLVLFQGIMVFMADLLGIKAPVSLLFTAGILFSLLILLGNGITLTTLWRQNKDLAQDQALLEWRLGQLQIIVKDLQALMGDGEIMSGQVQGDTQHETA